jgi:hypothetical protein
MGIDPARRFARDALAAGLSQVLAERARISRRAKEAA